MRTVDKRHSASSKQSIQQQQDASRDGLDALLSCGTWAQRQNADQSHRKTQTSDATAISAQSNVGNNHMSVRNNNPGDNHVDQHNQSSATGHAENDGETEQEIVQEEVAGCQGSFGLALLDQLSAIVAEDGSGACGGEQSQRATQSNRTQQDATSTARSSQDNVSNNHVSIRNNSPGDDHTDQQNTSTSSSEAENHNETTQNVDQDQRANCEADPSVTNGDCGGDQSHESDQSNVTGQNADSTAESSQSGTSNRNISMRNNSAGNNNVNQANTSAAYSDAHNDNKTRQTSKHEGDCPPQAPDCGHSNQSNQTDQQASATARSNQSDVSNYSSSQRINSPGDENVNQTNRATTRGTAKNGNSTEQDPDGCGAQDSCDTTNQNSEATADSTQSGAQNTFVSNRQNSPGSDNWTKESSTSETPEEGDTNQPSGAPAC